MPDQDRKALIAEAADIFVRLREDPKDPDLLAERDAFRQRGPAEREIYARVTRAWTGAGRKPWPNIALILACLGALAVAAYVFADPVRTLILADFSTRYDTREVALASGDSATLDAGTALTDETGGAQRHLTLLEGAALFDVSTDGRPFVVSVGDLDVEVLGTRFEVARTDDTVAVAVREGVVRVSTGKTGWTLTRGERLSRSDAGGTEIADIDPAAVAAWQHGRFVADGLTFAQVAEVIDRRLPGRIFIADAELARARVSGTIDLRDPDGALAALAAARGARILSAPALGRLVLP